MVCKENFTSSILQGYGIDNDLVGKDGYDLLAWLEQNQYEYKLKLHKKLIQNRGKNVARYNFQTNYGGQKTPISKIQCDLLALVALDKRTIHFMLPENLTTTKKIYEQHMTLENEKMTFLKVFDTLKKMCTCS